jgi:hypothetical protein
MIRSSKSVFKRISFYSLAVILSSQTKVLSQPSFTPDSTPLCDYSIVRGAQNELNKIINDYKLKNESEAKWEVSIDMKEIDLVYEARKYYNCDLKNQLQKPIIFKKPYFPYIPRYR